MSSDDITVASHLLAHGPNSAAKSRAKTQAYQAETQCRALLADITRLPDAPGQRIHVLFLGLYLKSIEQWLRCLEHTKTPEYTFLVIEQFFEIYVSCVSENLETPLEKTPLHWCKYHRLSRKLTIASPISTHLRLIKLGVRAHIQHDLTQAFRKAALNYQEMFGVAVNFNNEKSVVLGRGSVDAFKTAVFDFVHMHHKEQHGWRKIVLFWYQTGIVLFSGIWISVVQKWRRKAYWQAQKVFENS